MNTSADIISEAARRTLQELDTLHPGAEVRAAIFLIDVQTETGDTHVLWNTEPTGTSSAWAHGLLSTAAHLSAARYQPTDTDDGDE